MPSEIDIYRSAKLLIDQHGEDAPIFAAMQADKCLAAGDLDGKAVWMRVIAAIEELTNTHTPGAARLCISRCTSSRRTLRLPSFRHPNR